MGRELHLDLVKFTCHQADETGGEKYKPSFLDEASDAESAEVQVFEPILQLIHKLFSRPTGEINQ